MKRLFIDRSTDVQSVAWLEDGGAARAARFDGLDCRSGDWTAAVLDFLGPEVPDEIVVGTGPGSFAGIRAALAFAQGCVMGWRDRGFRCAVTGLSSACALAEPDRDVTVVGDARQGKCWVAAFHGLAPAGDVRQVEAARLADELRGAACVVTPDAKRIDALLREASGAAYAGGRTPTAEGLARAVAANPALAKPEPLPIYLNPAVRTA